MGVIILISDIAWLVVGASYTYTPWLVLGIIIFIATLVWLAMDISLMRAPSLRKEDQQKASSTSMKK